MQQVVSPGLDSPNDNEALSPLLEVVDNLEQVHEDKRVDQGSNLYLRPERSSRDTNNSEMRGLMNNDPQGRTTSSGLDVVSLASTLASDLAHLVESMNLADRPTNTSIQGNANKGGRGGRPLTARAQMGQEGRFSKLDMSAAELSSELNLAFGDSVGTTPTPPPTCQAFSTPTPPPNCPPPPPPQLNNQALLNLASSDERSGEAQSYPSLNPGQNNGTPRQTNEAEQVSMEEFLESCRATSLLAELEDEEELPDAEEEENEEDCDDSEDCEDNYDEEGLSSQEVRNMFGKRKTWDDDHVLKRKFSALIPAFDPRPGRTNTPQTSDLEVPGPGTSSPPPAAAPQG